MADNKYSLVYNGGNYYKIYESMKPNYGLSPIHGFFGIEGSHSYLYHYPMHRLDPFVTPLSFWEHIDARYRYIATSRIQQFKKTIRAMEPNESEMDYMLIPVGTKVTLKTVASVTVCFGSEDNNYTTEINENDIYRIDYAKDGAIESILGKVVKVSSSTAEDFSGNKSSYAVLKVDCSSNYGSDIKIIDSRNIRYIKSIRQMNDETTTTVSSSYVGSTEPDPLMYAGWYDTTRSKYYTYDYDTKTWVEAPDKPTDELEDGYTWSYDYTNKKWVVKELPEHTLIPAKPLVDEDGNSPGTYEEFVYNSETNKWEIVAKTAIPTQPTTTPTEGKEWVYDSATSKWIQVWKSSYIPKRPTQTLETGYIWCIDETERCWFGILESELKTAKPTTTPDSGYEWIYELVTMTWKQYKTSDIDAGTVETPEAEEEEEDPEEEEETT